MTTNPPDPRLVLPPELTQATLGTRLRRYFLTGLVIAAPLAITASVTWWFINLIDGLVKPLIPNGYLARFLPTLSGPRRRPHHHSRWADAARPS